MMIYTLERLTQPEIEPLTIAELRVHLRAYAIAAEDTMLDDLIKSAREWVEEYTGRVLIDQTWRLNVGEAGVLLADGQTDIVAGTGVWTASVDGGILLHKSPVIAIESFVSVDGAGVETVIEASKYELREKDSKWPRLYGVNGTTWSGPLRVTFRAGYADRTGSPQFGAEVVPRRLLHGMKLWAEAMYDRDEKLMPILINVAEKIVKPERADLQMA